MMTQAKRAGTRWRTVPATVVAAALLAACATQTPYQRQNEGFGYHDYEVAPGVYSLSFTGSAGTSLGSVQRYWHRRAAEICGGPDRYEILAKDPDGRTVLEPTPNVLWPQKYPRVESLIRCRPQ